MYTRGVSTITGKKEIISYIFKNTNKNDLILDVGFGAGTYGKLLKELGYTWVDGIDIYPDKIEELELDKVYDHIFIEDIRFFYHNIYDLIILGDVLEHLNLDDSIDMLSRMKEGATKHIVVSIPFSFPQGEIDNNPHEKHLQPNITKEYMKEKFPDLELIYSSEMEDNPGYEVGVYVWEKEI